MAIKKGHDKWATRFDFLLASIGCSVGFGNVWRFPYLLYKSGGGAFFIPFFISLFIGGLSVFFLEVIQGQFMSAGAIKVWKMAPLFEGIGYVAVTALFIGNCYYNVLIAWTMRFLFASFTWKLPWQTCGNEWNTERCVEDSTTSNDSNVTTFNNFSTDPAAEYWEREVLGLSDGIEHVGNIKVDLLICLAISWIIVYVSVCKGIRTSGRVMYFTATAPYVILFILIARALFLPGAWEGLKFYLMPDFSKLAEIQVWADAGSQVFFSFTIGWGVLNSLGCHNPWKHNSFRDSVIFAAVDAFTCIIAGFVIFPVLGYMAYLKGCDISDVAEEGPGLVFVVYPKIVSLMPLAPFWSCLFFIMLILVGIDTEFCGVEAFTTAAIDIFPASFSNSTIRQAIFTAACCLVKFLVGLTMITNGGMYVFQILDYYTGCRVIMLIALMECVVVGWVYGSDRFLDNIAVMWNQPLWPPFRTCLKLLWTYITPAFVLGQYVLNTLIYTGDASYQRSSGATYEFPGWALVMGWIIAYANLLFIPAVALIKIFQLPASMPMKQRVEHLMKPVLKSHMVLPGAKPDSYTRDPEEEEQEEQASAMI